MAAEELVRERIGLNPCDYRRSVTALANIFCSAMSALVEHHRERHELQSEFPQINFDLLPSESVSVMVCFLHSGIFTGTHLACCRAGHVMVKRPGISGGTPKQMRCVSD